MRRFALPDAVGDLLALPIVSVLATLRRDGYALLSPVWHEWRDGGLYVCISEDVKARHIRRDPRVSLVVAESVLPYRGVEARGIATLSMVGYHAVAERIATRYLGPIGREYVASAPGGLVVRIEPVSLRVWDLADEFANLWSAPDTDS